MTTSLGRISGPLLKSTLVRDGVDLQFQNLVDDTTAILYIDVTNGRIGVNKNDPGYALDISGTSNTTSLIAGEATIDSVYINDSTITTTSGSITIQGATETDAVIIPLVDITNFANPSTFDDTATFDDSVIISGLTENRLVIVGVDGLIEDTADLTFDGSKLTVDGNLDVTGTLTIDGDLVIKGAVTIGDSDTDNISVAGEFISSLIPNVADTYSLGSSSKRWKELFSQSANVGDIEIVNNTISVTTPGQNIVISPGAGGSVEILGNFDFGDLEELRVSNLKLIGDGNRTELLSLDSNSDLYLSAAGSGRVYINDIDIFLPEGNVYWVTVNGNDLNDGLTSQTSFLTVKAALAAASAGDQVRVGVGTFAEELPLTVPIGVTVQGSGIRSTQIKPTSATRDKDVFLLNGETTVMDLTIREVEYNSGNDTGYAFRYATGATVTLRSAYVKDVTVLNFGSSVRLATNGSGDPYGYDAADAGRGILVDGSVLTAGSLEAAMLFDSVTLIVPNSKGLIVKEGARVEWLNSFTYFASQGIEATAGVIGKYGEGKTRLTIGGASGTIAAGNVLSLYDTDGTTVIASGTIESYNSGLVTFDGRVDNFEIQEIRTQKTPTDVGDAQLSTAQKKFGTASLLLDGTGDAVSVASATDLAFGTQDFAIEMFVYLNANGVLQYLYDNRNFEPLVAPVLYIAADNTVRYLVNGSDRITGTTTLTTGQWYHVAVARSSTSTKLFIDGTQEGSTYTDSNSYAQYTAYIGARFAELAGNRYSLNGYIDELRISKNSARYTTGFTPTIAEFVGDKDTSLLIHFNGTNASTNFVDDITNVQDIRSSGGGTATAIINYDRKDFGAEIRSIASANVYGVAGVKADGVDVRVRLTGHDFGYIGAGKDFSNNDNLVNTSAEVVEANSGKVFYQSTDQYGDYRIGDLFYVNQRTGVTTLEGGAFDISSITGINFTDGPNTTIIDPIQVRTGQIVISGNTITALTGNINLSSPTIINSSLQVNSTITANSLLANNLTSSRVVTVGTSGLLEDNSNLTFDGSTLTITGDLDVDNININGNNISATNTDGDITITPDGTGVVTIVTDTALIIPSGDSTSRPSAASVGDAAIRYNETSGRFEGTVNGNWTGLGGVVDIDQNTYITAEETPNDDTLRFYINGNQEATIDVNGLTVGNINIDGNSITSTDTDGNVVINPNGIGTIELEADTNITGSLTISDLTSTRLVIAGTDGVLEDSTDITFNGTTFNVGQGDFTVNTSTSEATLASATVSDLTSTRLVIAGTSGSLDDSADITFDGTTLNIGQGDFTFNVSTNEATLASATVSDLTSTRLVIAGTSGSLDDSADLTFDGTTFNVGQGDFTFNVSTNEATLASATVSDLTSTRLVIAGTSGSLDDSAELTFDGTTLNIGQGDFTVDTSTGEATLASATVSDLTSTRLVIAGTSGSLDDSADITFDGTTFNVGQGGFTFNTSTGETSVLGTLNIKVFDDPDIVTTFSVDNITGDVTSFGMLTISNVTVESLTSNSIVYTDSTSGLLRNGTDLTFDGTTFNIGQDNFTVDVTTGNVNTLGSLDVGVGNFTVDSSTGNIDTVGTIGVSGEATLASATVSDLTSTRLVIAGTSGSLDDSADLIFDGTTLNIGQDNFIVSATTGNVTTLGSLTAASVVTSTVSSAGDITINPNLGNGSLIITGNLTVQGTTTTVESLVTVIEDPIFRIGGTDSTIINDGKDRGIEYAYDNGSGIFTTGFFGVDKGTDEFVFIPNSTNNNEIISGATGKIRAGILKSDNLTNSRILFSNVNKEIVDSANLTFDGTTFNIGQGNFTVNASTGTISTSGNINLTGLDTSSVLFSNASGDISTSSNITFSDTNFTVGVDLLVVDIENSTTTFNSSIVANDHVDLTTLDITTVSQNQVLFKNTSSRIVGNAGLTFDETTGLAVNIMTVDSTLTVNGNVTIGSDSSDTVTINAEVSSSIVPSLDATYNLGSEPNRWDTVYAITLDAADLTIDNSIISSTVLDNDITIATLGEGKVILDATSALTIPSGTTEQRVTGSAGDLRFNTSINLYEGFDGTNWVTLSGIRDLDNNTYIKPEASPGANDDTFYFVAGGVEVATLNQSGLSASGFFTDDIQIVDNRIELTTSNSDLDLIVPDTSVVNLRGGLVVRDNVVLGADSVSTITVNGRFNTNLVPVGITGLGNVSNSWSHAYVGNLLIDQSNITTTGSNNITITLDTGYLNVNANTAIKIPVGTDAQRPSVLAQGQMRYNTESEKIEIYDGARWLAQGAVIDADGNTYIVAETSTGADNNQIDFYADGEHVFRFDQSGILFQDTTTNIIEATAGDIILRPGPSEGSTANVIIEGNLQVTGTTTQIDSTVITVNDPVFQIGEGQVDDNLDRGIKFLYNNGTETVGFFGMDDSTNEFVFIPNATDTGSVFSGAPGNASFGSIKSSSLTLDSFLIGGANGTITSTNEITFSSNLLTLGSNNAIVIDTDTDEISLGYTTTIEGGLSIAGNLITTSDSVNDLGELGTAFRNLYLSESGIYLDTNQISKLPSESGFKFADENSNPTKIVAGVAELTQIDISNLTISDQSIALVGFDLNIITDSGRNVVIPNSDVLIDNDVTIEGNLIVGGFTTLSNIAINSVTSEIINAPKIIAGDIEIEDNVIEMIGTGGDLILQTAGTGRIYIPDDELVVNGDITGNGDIIGNGNLILPSIQLTSDARIQAIGSGQDLELIAQDGFDVRISSNKLLVDTEIETSLAIVGNVEITANTIKTFESGYDLILEAYNNFIVNIPNNDLNVGGSITIGNGINVSGNITATGDFSAGSATISNLSQNGIVVASGGGALVTDSNITFIGTTLSLGNGQFTVGSLSGNVYTAGDITADGNVTIGGLATFDQIAGSNLTTGRIALVGNEGTIIDNANLTYNNGLNTLYVPVLAADLINISSNVITTTHNQGNIIIRPSGTGIVEFDTNQSIRLPIGSTAARPVGVAGEIRYNIDLDVFEGFFADVGGSDSSGAWRSLGGVRDIDGNTLITAESTPGGNENVLTFISNNTTVATMNEITGLIVNTDISIPDGLVLSENTINTATDFDLVLGSNGTGIVDIQSITEINASVTLGALNTDEVIFVAKIASDLIPATTGTYDIGNSTDTWRNADFSGTVTTANLTATTVDINGGAIDGTTIGSTVRSTGAFTTLTANNAVTFTLGTGSTNTTSGTLVVSGGAGFSQNIFVGGTGNFTGKLTAQAFEAQGQVDFISSQNITISPTGTGVLTINPTTTANIDNTNIGASTRGSGAFTTLSANNATTFTADVGSTNSTTGTLVVTGGLGVSENINLDGSITSLGAGEFVGITSTGLVSLSPIDLDVILTPSGDGTVTIQPGTLGTIDNMSIGATTRSTGAFTTLAANGIVSISNSTQSTDTTSGAITVAGGVGIGGNLNVGGDISAVDLTITGAINLSPANSNVVISPTGTGEVIIQPQGGLTINPAAIGTINNINIGSTVPGSANFTSISASSTVTIDDVTSSTSSTSGALTVAGGVGIVENLNVGGNIGVTGDLTINGSSVLLNTTTVAMDDPVLTIGGVNSPANNDSKDRGIEFRYHDGANPKIGFFGFDNNLGKFVFIPDAANGSEVFSGDSGIISAIFEGQITSSNATLSGGTIENITVGINTPAAARFTTLTIDGSTTIGDADTDFVTFNALINSSIRPSSDDTYDLGDATHEWRNLYVDGIANIDSLIADTVQISNGTINDTSIGASTRSTGAFTTLAANGEVTFSGNINSTGVSSGTVVVTGGVGLTGNLNAGGTGEFVGLTTTGAFTANPTNEDISLQPTGSGVVTINPGTLGTIDNMSIGATTRSTGAFTTLAANGQVSFTGGTQSTSTGNGAVTVAGGVGITQNLNVGGNAIIDGNLTVNGTTTTFNSTQITIDDPIFTLGGDTAPTVNDNKDRGIEFRYYDDVADAAKLGFMGWNESSGKFNLLVDASNISENFSGTTATLQADIEGNITSPLVNITGGTIDDTIIGSIVPTSATFTEVTINNNLTIGENTSDTVIFNSLIDSSLVPNTDNTYDLGTSLNQWKDIYINGVAYIDSLNADLVDIDSGAIDGITLGTNSAVTEAQIDNLNINGNTISATNTNGSITLTPIGEGSVNVETTKSIKIAVGTTAERPSSALTGQIRFNTTTTQFEGYQGSVWSSLGGVRDVDGNTYIIPEESPGNNDNVLQFYAGGTRVARMDQTGFILDIGTITAAAVNITETTISTTDENSDLVLSPNGTGSVVITSVNGSSSPDSGALTVDGGLGVEQNIYAGGDLVVYGSSTLGDSTADSTVINGTTTVNLKDNTISVFDLTESTNSYFKINTTNSNELITFGSTPQILFNNVTESSDKDTGAVVIEGGVGIEKNVNIGGNITVKGSVTFDDGLVKLNASNTSTTNDFGVYGRYNDGVNRYLGIVADASDSNKFKLFNNLTEEPTSTLNTSGSGYTIGTLVANLESGTVTGLTQDILVEDGGTGVGTFTLNGVLYGNSTSPLQTTAAAGDADSSNSNQILTVDETGIPIWTDTIDGGSF